MSNPTVQLNPSPPTDEQASLARAQVQRASEQWIAAFNRGDVAACAGAYAQAALMQVTPMGSYRGRAAIAEFWASIVASGANTLVYDDIAMEVLNEVTVRLSASWTMNIGHGVITDETWARQPNGSWALTHDSFEVKSWQPDSPKAQRQPGD